ncbi:MAG: DUF177 domain-containing protein [Pseudomonadota bacterium]
MSVRKHSVAAALIDVTSIPAAGEKVIVQTNDATRSEIAARFGIPDVASFQAEVTLHPRRDGLIHAQGKLSAEVVQSCVVSLEAVRQSVEEEIDELFVPPAARDSWLAAGGLTDDALMDAEAVDPFALAEPLETETLDLGEVVVQLLSLALDPYPRASGVELPPGMVLDEQGAEEIEPAAGPFDVLEKLRRIQ